MYRRARGVGEAGFEYFMAKALRGTKTHAINKKTKRTYCGKEVLKPFWKSLGVAPSTENEPTCRICRKLVAFERDRALYQKLDSAAKDLKNSITEFLCTKVTLRDVDGLGRFVTVVKHFMAGEKTRVQVEKAEPPGSVLWLKINSDEELAILELHAFAGEDKTMNVPLEDVVETFEKQFKDFQLTFGRYRALICRSSVGNAEAVKRAVAGVRNAAGCVFLKLKEEVDR